MKYWRGWLVAGILAACSWALTSFAKAHTALVDMIYPYISRMIQSYMAQWSAQAEFCVWQAAVLVGIILVLATFVLMLVMKWNPIQWAGWVLAGVCLVSLLNTGIYGLNEYAGPLAEDIRLESAQYGYTVSELKDATVYYRDLANQYADKVSRDSQGALQQPDFDVLAEMAGEGFTILTKQEHYPVFAGSTVPVKKLGWAGRYDGVSGKTVALTGEAAVNPNTPAVYMPFAMCHEMAHRMCIAVDSDAEMAAFLACRANPDVNFQYAAYFTAYRWCQEALDSVSQTTGDNLAQTVAAGANLNLQRDLQSYEAFFGGKKAANGATCDALVLWHVQTVVLPQQQPEEVPQFDPKDPDQVDLTGIVNAKLEG